MPTTRTVRNDNSLNSSSSTITSSSKDSITMEALIPSDNRDPMVTLDSVISFCPRLPTGVTRAPGVTVFLGLFVYGHYSSTTHVVIRIANRLLHRQRCNPKSYQHPHLVSVIIRILRAPPFLSLTPFVSVSNTPSKRANQDQPSDDSTSRVHLLRSVYPLGGLSSGACPKRICSP